MSNMFLKIYFDHVSVRRMHKRNERGRKFRNRIVFHA